jgi:hypothetical protein
MNTELLTMLILKSDELKRCVQSLIFKNTNRYERLKDDINVISVGEMESINPMSIEEDIRGKHKNHFKNPAYLDMNPKQKQQAITRNYYNNKGKLLFIKRKFCKKFNLDKDIFKECKTEDEVNKTIYNIFKEKNMDDETIYTITKIPRLI